MSYDIPDELDTHADAASTSALEYIALAWSDARDEGISSDALSKAALFAALSSMVTEYGETAVIELVEKLPKTIEKGEYTVRKSLQ